MALQLKQKIDPHKLRGIIGELSGFSSQELADPLIRWDRQVSSWRALGMYVGVDNGMTYKNISKVFGAQTMTAFNSYRKVTSEITKDDKVAQLINVIQSKLDAETNHS